jgi:hydrogenase maturation protease
MSALTVVGLGSELSGDDAIGLVLVERLRGRLADAAGVACVCWPDADALTIAHDLLELRGAVLLVDCAEMGLPPATCRVLDRGQVRLHVKESPVSVHGIGLAEALELAAALGLRAAVRLFAVQPGRLDPGAPLSAEVEAQLLALVAALEEATRESSRRTSRRSSTTSFAPTRRPGSIRTATASGRRW